jgi:hypothetical protein
LWAYRLLLAFDQLRQLIKEGSIIFFIDVSRLRRGIEEEEEEGIVIYFLS